VEPALPAALAAGSGFWTENQGLLAVGVSLLALAVSIVTARQNLVGTRRIAEDAARHDATLARMATYQRMHELLVDPVAASGRRRLFQAAQTGRFPDLGEADWDAINYSLALYDTLGGYVHRGQVDEEVVLDAWHHPLANIAGPVRGFVAYRAKRGVHQPWAHLMQLLAKGEQYPCRCPGVATSSSTQGG
jgi:hypothetical protein